jgi:hypothetical protein
VNEHLAEDFLFDLFIGAQKYFDQICPADDADQRSRLIYDRQSIDLALGHELGSLSLDPPPGL